MFPSKALDLLVNPWFLNLVTSVHFGGNVFVHEGMYLLFEGGPEMFRLFPRICAGMPEGGSS